MSRKSKVPFTFKILLLGDPAVGKTSLIRRFIHGKFTKDYLVTLGMEPYSRYETIDGTTVALNLWDIAGQQKYESFRSVFLKGAQGAIVVGDVTRRSTFVSVDQWVNDARKLSPNMTVLLVGNKSDLKDNRAFFRREGNQKARETENCLGYIETSALTGHRVVEAFHTIASHILEQQRS